MNQQKTGTFLKGLRHEKNITQEQLAEQLGVTRRTVSRWETGSNLPDLDILIELADYYEVDLRELLEGERKSGNMNQELKETVLKVADYSSEEKQRMIKVMHWLFMAGAVSFVLFFVLLFCGSDEDTFIYGYVMGISLGIPFASVCVGAVMTSRYAAKIREFKKRMLRTGSK